MAGDLEQVLFLSLTGLADANHCRHSAGCRGRRQKIALQRIAARPGNRHDLAARASVPNIVAGAFAHARDHGLARLVSKVERERGCLVVVARSQLLLAVSRLPLLKASLPRL